MSIEKVQYPNTNGVYDNFKWPEGIPNVPFSQLTKKQQKRVIDAFRFSGFRAGKYQGSIQSSKMMF
jgi:hypothetical protein